MIEQNTALRQLQDDHAARTAPRAGGRGATQPHPFTTEILPLSEIGRVFAPLQDLADTACEPNVFFEPIVLKAAMEELRTASRHFLVLVWDGALGGTLAGAMPFEIARHRWGPFLAVTQGWNHKMGVRGTPLIRPGRAEAFWSHALDAIAAGPFPRMLLIHTMVWDGEGRTGLSAACGNSGRALAVLDRTSVITLKTDLDGDDYLSKTMSSRRRRRMKKALADLGAMGTLEHHSYREEGAAISAFMRFLELEAAGWKGREGTAIMRKPDALRFFTKAISAFARRGQVQIDTLELDNRPIGMSVVVESSDMAFCWKTSYDEALAKYNPGYLTVMDVTRRLIANPAIAHADSCTEAGHPLMDGLWSERSEAADVLIDTQPDGGAAAFAVAAGLERTRRRSRQRAKTVYHALRGRLRRWRQGGDGE